MFDRIPPILDCIVGMNILITQNVNKNDQIIHGTIGKLYSILFERDTTFKCVTDKNSGVKVRIPNKKNLYLLIEVTNPKFEPWEGLLNNVYPISTVFPRKETHVKKNNFNIDACLIFSFSITH